MSLQQLKEQACQLSVSDRLTLVGAEEERDRLEEKGVSIEPKNAVGAELTIKC